MIYPNDRNYWGRDDCEQLAYILLTIEATDPSVDGTAGRPDAEARYAARNGLIWQAVGFAVAIGHPAGVAIDPAESDWPVAYIELPTGQVSWHVPAHTHPWDGHTSVDKTGRIKAYAAMAEQEAIDALARLEAEGD